MPNIRPQRDVDSHDIINQFRWNPSGTYPTTKGTFVKIVSGLMVDQTLQMLGNVGAAYGNTVSQRYGVQPFVAAVTASGDNPLGMLLYDVRTVDENGELLIYRPDKAAQMQVSISGQPVPVCTRGLFIYSGVAGNPQAGGKAFLSGDGQLAPGDANCSATVVGQFLGPKDQNGNVYLWLNIR